MTPVRRRIFMVEDEALIAMELRDHLQELGYEVCGHAARGEAALRLIPEANPDLVLLDINLGHGISGLEVAEQLHRDSDVPIVFLTAYSDAALTQRAAVTGSFGYLVKPYQPAALQANIEMALYKHDADRKLRTASRQLDAAVTALRVQNSELRRSHALRRAAFDATADGLLVLGGYERANRRFFEMWGVPPEVAELGGEALLTWLLGQVVDPAGLLPSNADLAGDLEVAGPIELRDGRIFERHIRPQILDGAVVGHVLSFRDVTGPRRAAAELRASEEQFHDLFEFAPDAILMVDEHGIIALANRQAETLLGHPRSALIGMSVDALVPAAQRDAHAKHRRGFPLDSTARPMGSRKRLLHALHRDGTRIPVDISLGPVRTATGSLVVAALRDVSEWLKRDEQQQSLESQLRHSQKLEALGTLAGGIAHDFNNLLSVIHSGVELARAELDPASPAAGRLDVVATAADRGALLIRQILAFSRRQPIRRVVTDVGPMVEEVAQLLRATLPATIKLDVDLGVDLPPVQVDTTQIHQVLMNLGTNAWHAIGAGPGRITIRLERMTAPPGARIVVHDDGAGMDAATLERIFEPFFTTKALGRGSGLGLSVVHGIIQEHGGRISVASTPGNGATFAIELPAALGPLSAAVPPPEAPGPGEGHVLYLDDEELLVTLGEALLHRMGYSVSAFSSATAALAALRADPHRFAAVVTDTNMPDMSGLDVAQEVARLRPDLPVVLVSGRAERTDEELAALGIHHHLDKPFGARELADVLHRAIRRATKSSASEHCAVNRAGLPS